MKREKNFRGGMIHGFNHFESQNGKQASVLKSHADGRYNGAEIVTGAEDEEAVFSRHHVSYQKNILCGQDLSFKLLDPFDQESQTEELLSKVKNSSSFKNSIEMQVSGTPDLSNADQEDQHMEEVYQSSHSAEETPERMFLKLSSENWNSRGSLSAPPLSQSAREFDDLCSEESIRQSAIGHFPGFEYNIASLESSVEKSQSVTPSPFDVLTGRGARITAHQGNVRYRQMITAYKTKYRSLPSKQEKYDFTIWIRGQIENYGGRFLTKHRFKDTWVIMDPNAARKKISQSLRETKE